MRHPTRVLAGLLVALLGAQAAGAGTEPAAVPRTREARKLAQQVLAGVADYHLSLMRTAAKGFDATYSVTRGSAAVGKVRCQWDADAGLSIQYQGSLEAGDGQWVEQMLQMAVGEALFSMADSENYYATETREAYLIADFGAASEQVKHRRILVARDLRQVAKGLWLADGRTREVQTLAAELRGALTVQSMTLTMRLPGRDPQRLEYVFHYEPHQGISFPQSVAIQEDSRAGKTAWAMALDKVAFSGLPAPGERRPIKLVARETEFGRLPEDEETRKTLQASPDGRHVAYVEKLDDKFRVVADGTKHETYDKIDSVTFTRDGRLLYRGKRGKQLFYVVDGKASEAYGLATKPILSPGGRQFAYAATLGKTLYDWFVVCGTEKGKTYPSIDLKRLVFSRDGAHLAYRVALDPERSLVVVDTTEGAEYTNVSPPVFCGDGTTVAYFANRDKDYFVVVGEKEHSRPVSVEADSLRVNRDGSRHAYSVLGAKPYVVVNGKPGPEADYVTTPLFSPDGRTLAYSARREGKYRVCGDWESEPYDLIEGIAFTRDSRRLVFRAKRGEKWLVVTNGREGKEYDGVELRDIRAIRARPSNRVAYTAERGDKQIVVIDGEESAAYDGVKSWELRQPVLIFSPDGEHVAYVAERGGKELVVLDGQEGKAYKRVWQPRFSPDGTRLAYPVEQESGEDRVVVVEGGKSVESKPYDTVYEVIFSPDGQHVAWHGRREGKNYVVVDGVAETRLRYENLSDLRFASWRLIAAIVDPSDRLKRLEIQIVQE
jgi:Tol biopolymer transport system component